DADTADGHWVVEPGGVDPGEVGHVERAWASDVATLPIWPDVVPTVGPAAIPTPANTSGARHPMTMAWPPPDDSPLTYTWSGSMPRDVSASSAETGSRRVSSCRAGLVRLWVGTEWFQHQSGAPPFGAAGIATTIPCSSAVAAQFPAFLSTCDVWTQPCSETMSARPPGRAGAVVGR